VTDDFLAYKPGNYTSGIYSEHTGFLQRINHEISVVGYSKDQTTGDEYWIGRNSWGNYWGNMGFFYIKMHSDNLKIETDCLAGDVSYTKPSNAAVFTQ
jgi:cathepsin X